MNTINIIGTLAAVLTTFASLPQAIKIIKKNTTKGVSAATYLILLGGTLFWVVYGILKTDWPIIISNAISSLISIIILILHLIPDKKIKEIHDKLEPEVVHEDEKL
jgi:MtN3 and saliva related transmembrane protein